MLISSLIYCDPNYKFITKCYKLTEERLISFVTWVARFYDRARWNT